jgi:hypothetical protein
LQEETGAAQRKSLKSLEGGYSARIPFKGTFPLPRPPLQVKEESNSDDKGNTVIQKQQSVQEKVAALAAYRMAKGLWRKCGEKWHKGYKCADSVQLNVLQEIWDLVQPDSPEESEDTNTPVIEHIFMAILEAAILGTEAPRTLKIKGPFKI